MPLLSVVATPIGNLGDITARARTTLAHCHAIVCEDTRSTGKLLQLLELPSKPLISFHSYSDPRKIDAILARLQSGEHLALVSDAGTPCISDPGYLLLSRCAEAHIPIEAVPGPSAFLAALMVSGLPIHAFHYLGFLPIKKGRSTLLRELHDEEDTVVFYESVHRIERTLRELALQFADQPLRKIVIAREITKMHENVIRTTVMELPACLNSLTKKGEFVVILGGA